MISNDKSYWLFILLKILSLILRLANQKYNDNWKDYLFSLDLVDHWKDNLDLPQLSRYLRIFFQEGRVNCWSGENFPKKNKSKYRDILLLWLFFYILLYYHICGIDKCCERNWVKPKIIKSFLTFFHKFQDPWFLLNPSSWPINILHWNYCYWWALLLWLISFFPLM